MIIVFENLRKRRGPKTKTEAGGHMLPVTKSNTSLYNLYWYSLVAIHVGALWGDFFFRCTYLHLLQGSVTRRLSFVVSTGLSVKGC